MAQKRWQIEKIAAVLTVGALLAVAPAVSADEIGGGEIYVPKKEAPPPPPPRQACPECPEGPNLGRVSLSMGVDMPSKYYFRGIIQEDRGFIAQPWAEVGFNLYESDGPISSVDITGGFWNSLHQKDTVVELRPDDNPWYETDLYGSIGVGLMDVVTASAGYTAYVSPNGSWDQPVQEVGFGLGFDDSELLGPLAMSPSVLFAIETEGSAFGDSKGGTYFEASGGPEIPLDDGDLGATLSIPLRVGLSLDNYYDDGERDSTFGFFEVGLIAGMPLSFIPSEYGSWSVSGGGYFMSLGHSLREANQDDWELIGIGSIAMAY